MEIPTKELIEKLIEPLDDEPPHAYSAFLFYAQLPLSERTKADNQCLEKIAEYTGMTKTTVANYRTNYEWNKRINQIDAYFFTQQYDERREKMRESNLQFAEDMKEIQDKAISIAKKGLAVAEALIDTAALANETKTTDYKKVLQDDGTYKVTPMTTTIVMKAELKDVAPLVNAVVKIPRQVMGLPTEALDEPIKISDASELEKLSDAELETKLREKQKQIEEISNSIN